MSQLALRRTLAAAAAMWAVALIVGTFIASRPEVPPVVYLLSAAIYEVGSLVCHQLPERSFHLWGAQWPVCARCAGIYVGAAIAAAAVVGVDVDRHPASRNARLAVLLASLPTALTLVYEWTTGQTPGNWMRAAAGFPLGAAIAWVLVSTSASSLAVEVH